MARFTTLLLLRLALFLIITLAAAACTPSAAPTALPEAESSPTPPQEATEQAPELQKEHRIGIRQVDGSAEFYDKLSGERIVVRGANYVYLPGSGETTLLKVGSYDGQRVRADFARLAGLGYNTVRVFLDHCNAGPGCIGAENNIGLNPDYLDNIADMMAAAGESGVYVLFTSNDLPDQGGYSEEANSGANSQFAGYRNSYYLRPQAISATRRYWSDLLTGLVERQAAFDAVLGWQLLNEQWMFRDQPPLSLSSGLVETTTGVYDMSSSAQKAQMVSEGLVYYIAQMKEEILLHDPTALVTMGFFVPELVAPGWYVETASLLQESALDFFDFHAYPGPLSLAAHAEAFGMLGYESKPILLGEYGAFRQRYSDLNSAARALTNWTADSCQLGFDGWLYWTYNTSFAVGDQTWGLTDEDGFLLELFSPANMPDPCARLEIGSSNLAYGKPVKTSASLPAEPASNAVDEDSATQWGAGAGPVQWIEIDLGALYSLSEVRLLVAQYPQGETVHRIQVRADGAAAYVEVHEFSGVTNDNEWLTLTLEPGLDDVRFIRVQTVSSPSWVAWKEIQVYGSQ